jgi:hypothetical protein
MYPCECLECGTNLEEPGTVIFWGNLPERAIAHLEVGADDGVFVILDGAHNPPDIDMQCVNCGAEIDFKIQDIDLDIEFNKNIEEYE